MLVLSENLLQSDPNTIELHYWFHDETHLMDALIQNRCEYEFLGILKEIASTFKVEITIETEPLANGGLKRLFKIASKDVNKNTIIVTLITSLLAAIIVTPIATSISKTTEILIQKLFEDSELKELEKEKLKLEIEKLKQETRSNILKLDSSNVVKKKRSNFYESLDNYPKIEKVTFIASGENQASLLEEQTVFRAEFKQFILVTDDLEPSEEDNAIIEIISPVLKKGAYKWMGIYNGENVSFSMKSKEFKNLIQTGQVQFKNGTSINCLLTIKKKIDNEGIEKIISIEVPRVNHYFENDKPVETSEGKKHRRKKEYERSQTELFSSNQDSTEL